MKYHNLKKLFAALSVLSVFSAAGGAVAPVVTYARDGNARGLLPGVLLPSAFLAITLAALRAVYGIIDRRYCEREDAANIKLLRRLANLDHLTGLANRRSMEDCLRARFNEFKSTNKPESVIMIDIDHFKNVNDSYGHAAGDLVIKTLASLLMRGCRTSDFVSRWGGEEFLIILDNLRVFDAAVLSERLRSLIAGNPIEYEGNTISITASFGVSEFFPGDTDYLAAIDRADTAMYRSKSGGNNRVSAYEKDPQS